MVNDEQLHKWVNGNLSEEEKKEFKLRPEYESLVELYKNTEGLSVPRFNEDEMLTNILKVEKSKTLPKKGRRVLFSNWVKYGVAASVLLLAAWLFWPDSNFIKYELAKGEKIEATLPDGSTFVLNAESELSYNKKNWETSRILQLNGEAFFEVQKGSKFSVQTPNGVVSVLGTKFNVRSRNNSLDVKCQSGKVGVANKEGNPVGQLIANDALRITEEGNVETWKTRPAQKPSWIGGIYSFKNVSLITVLEEVERQYEITLDSKNIDTKILISTSFQKGNIDMALKKILTPFGISYEKLNNQNIVLKK